MDRFKIPIQKGNNGTILRMHESAHVQGGHC